MEYTYCNRAAFATGSSLTLYQEQSGSEIRSCCFRLGNDKFSSVAERQHISALRHRALYQGAF